MEGRVFTPEDIIATITLEDVDVPNDSGCLNIYDVLSAVHYKTMPSTMAWTSTKQRVNSWPQFVVARQVPQRFKYADLNKSIAESFKLL